MSRNVPFTRLLVFLVLFSVLAVPGVARAELPDAGLIWTSRSSGSTAWLKGIADGAGAVVAVGDAGEILTSPDGVTWARRTSGTTKNLTDVIYGASAFVAVGQGGMVLSSSSGTTWAEQKSGTAEKLNDVAFGAGLFVAVGDGGALITSPDGTTWTVRNSGTKGRLLGVAYGGSQFVAVGDGGTVLTSQDGTRWTARTSGTAKALSGAAYGNGQFLVVGESDTILTSKDGAAWTAHKVDSTLYGLWSVAFGDGQFVAVGGAGNILSSADGTVWVRNDTGKVFNFIEDVAYINGQFVAVGNRGAIRTSGSMALKPGSGTTQPAQPSTPAPQPAPAKPLVPCAKGQVTGNRVVRSMGEMVIEADAAVPLESGKTEYCGNVIINGVLKLDGKLTAPAKGSTGPLAGEGTLYIETALPHYRGQIPLFAGQFSFDGNLNQLALGVGHNLFLLAGLDVEIKKLFLLGGGGVRLEASAELPFGEEDALGLTKESFKLDLNNLEIWNGEVSIKGGLSLPLVKMGKSAFGLKDLKLEYDSREDAFFGRGEFVIKDVFGVMAGAGVKEGRLDRVGLGVSELDLPIGQSGLFLESIYGEVGGLAKPPFYLQAEVDIGGGPEIFDRRAATGDDLTVRISAKPDFTASGKLVIIEEFTLAEAELSLDFREQLFAAKGSLNVLDVVVGKAELRIGRSEFYGHVDAELRVPKKVPFIGGDVLAGAGATVDLDGIEVTARIPKVDLTVEYLWKEGFDWDVSVHLFGANTHSVPLVASTGLLLPAAPVGTLVIPAGTKVALVRLEWDQGDGDFTLTAPDGTKLTPASPGATYVKRTVNNEAYYVLTNPHAGTWNYAVSTNGAQSFTVGAYGVDPAPGLRVTAPARDLPASGPITITWETDAPAGSKVSLFYDQKGEGFGGTRIAADLDAKLGAYTWNPQQVNSGTYFIYALVDTEKHAPVYAYAPGKISLTNAQTPAAPRGLSARAVGGRVELTWSANTEADLAGYQIRLVNSKESAAVGPVTRFVMDGLKTGETHQFVISAFDADGFESMASAPVSVFLPKPSPPKVEVQWPAPQLTRESALVLSGQVEQGASAVIYLGREQVATGVTGSFTRQISLRPGTNKVRIVASKSGGDTAEQVREYYLDAIPPQLTLRDADIASGRLALRGMTEPRAALSLNGRPVSVQPDGSFSTVLALEVGANQIELVSRDEAGNENRFRTELTSTVKGTAACGTVFPDVTAGNQACAAIEQLAGLGVVKGYPDGTFQPERGVTRAEFAKMLVVALGRTPDLSGSLPFSDTRGHWASSQGFLQTAARLNAIAGFPDGSFKPDDPVTRAQVVKIAAAAAGLSASGTPPYSDVKAEDWYAGWVAAALQARIVGPAASAPLWTGSRFEGERPATRAEAAMVLANLIMVKK